MQNTEAYRLLRTDELAVDIYKDMAVVHVFGEMPNRAELEKSIRKQVPVREFFYKDRRGKGAGEAVKASHQETVVEENGHKFLINLSDYLDVGLFLDHRETRKWIESQSAGKQVLNTFAYTGSFSVYAASGGAEKTTSVDLSTTYLDWAEKNLKLNGFVGPHHHLIKADVIAWLGKEHGKYGLIFCDPPTFSNSKAMEGFFEVQKDHVGLIWACVKRLTPGGTLVFSNNFRGFKLDLEALSGLKIQEISHQTLPKDFERNPKIHKTFLIQKT